MSDYTVGRVAALAGVTVRTLHHYDEIGLVQPSDRTAAGYRVYGPADIERLQQVLLYRRLGFALEEIASLIDDPAIDAVAHLRRQRELLLQRRDGIDVMVTAIDQQLEAHAMGMQLTPEEQLEVFGTDKVGGEWADEAQQRWGETETFRESQRRTAQYSKEDWANLKAESDADLRELAQALRDGVAAAGSEGRALAEKHRQYLGRWFYDCSYEMHRALADTYVSDPRFRQTFDSVQPGLAEFLHDAIHANADARD